MTNAPTVESDISKDGYRLTRVPVPSGQSVFWRDEPLSAIESKLLALVFEAHHKSAFRQNPSSLAVQNSADGSHDYTKAIASALMTLGERHGPLVATARLLSLDDLDYKVRQMLAEDLKIPGFGSSFKDDIWDSVAGFLDEHFPEIADKINEVKLVLHGQGIKIEPNPSAWTAATALALKMPIELTPWIFVSGRLNAWSTLFIKAIA